MASLPKSAAKLETENQLKLLIALKKQLDLVYKQLNHYRGACKSVDRLNRAVRAFQMIHEYHRNQHDTESFDDYLLYEFVKFERNYRVSKRKLRKLDQQLLEVNLYDNLYDLYESLVIGDSIESDEDLCDSSPIDPTLVCEVGFSRPAEIDDTPVDDFDQIPIHSDFDTRNEKTVTENAHLGAFQSETSNLSLIKSTTDSRQPHSGDTGDSSQVIQQPIQRQITTSDSVPTTGATTTISASVDETGCRRPLGIDNTSVGDFTGIKLESDFANEIQSETRQMEISNLSNSIIGFPSLFQMVDDSNNGQQSVSSSQQQAAASVIRNNLWFPMIEEKQNAAYYQNHPRPYNQHHHPYNGSRFEGSSTGYLNQPILDDRHSNDAIPVFRCDFIGCNFMTFNTDCLKEHRAVHFDERPFKCDQCDKSFKVLFNLNQHKHTHDSEPRFHCNWTGCQYTSHRRVNLITHLTVHTGERPYRCNRCDKSFKALPNLCRHKRTHDTEPRYRCRWEGCQYGSHQLTNLTRHQTLAHSKPKL